MAKLPIINVTEYTTLVTQTAVQLYLSDETVNWRLNESGYIEGKDTQTIIQNAFTLVDHMLTEVQSYVSAGESLED